MVSRVAPRRGALRASPLVPSTGPAVLAGLAAFALVACSGRTNDPPASVTPTLLGSGERIVQINDPSKATHPANGAPVALSGATYLLTDTFDETANGKSRGTVYLQDIESDAPYSGISLFSPTFLPADLSLAPGDVVSLTGTYAEETSIGSAMFANGEALVQISKPVVQFSFEYRAPTVGSTIWAPQPISVSDLDDYKLGIQWQSMLVTIQNVTFTDNLSNDGSGRYVAHITSDTSGNGPTISNELFDLNAWNQAAPTKIARGNTFKSVTGIVTWFFNFHIAPRSPDDIVVQ